MPPLAYNKKLSSLERYLFIEEALELIQGDQAVSVDIQDVELLLEFFLGRVVLSLLLYLALCSVDTRKSVLIHLVLFLLLHSGPGIGSGGAEGSGLATGLGAGGGGGRDQVIDIHI